MTQTRRILSKTSKACIKQPTIVAKSKIQKTLYARSCARACESPEIALPNYNLSDGARAVGKSAPGGPLHPHPTSYAAYTPVDREVFDHRLTDRLPSFVRYSLFFAQRTVVARVHRCQNSKNGTYCGETLQIIRYFDVQLTANECVAPNGESCWTSLV